MKRNANKQQGLTLIELLITLAIIGIIAAIAIPSYEHYTTKTKRAVAKTELQHVRSLLEQYYVNNKSYTSDLTELGFANSPFSVNKSGDEVATTASDAIYEISVNTTAPFTYCASCTYEIVATPKNTQVKDTDCKTLWYGSLGNKGSSVTGAKNCW